MGEGKAGERDKPEKDRLVPVFFYAQNAAGAPIGAAKKGKCGSV
nr:MAG TPA: hypothetical protein [Caudoviricetes sp.]